MIKRFDRLDIATTDLSDAAATYLKNFDFEIQQTENEAIIAIGEAQIRLRSGAAVADVISASGEGLAAIWLETEDVDMVADKLKRANVAVSPIQVEANRRILAIHPDSANMVQLFIFDRLH